MEGRDVYRNTVLHLAAVNGHEDVCIELLQHTTVDGCSSLLDALNVDGCTPLDLAKCRPIRG